jgi:hypothetical protein
MAWLVLINQSYLNIQHFQQQKFASNDTIFGSYCVNLYWKYLSNIVTISSYVHTIMCYCLYEERVMRLLALNRRCLLKSSVEHELSWLRVLMVLLIPLRKYQNIILIRPWPVPPTSFPFFINPSFYHLTLYNLDNESILKHNHPTQQNETTDKGMNQLLASLENITFIYSFISLT